MLSFLFTSRFKHRLSATFDENCITAIQPNLMFNSMFQKNLILFSLIVTEKTKRNWRQRMHFSNKNSLKVYPESPLQVAFDPDSSPPIMKTLGSIQKTFCRE